LVATGITLGESELIALETISQHSARLIGKPRYLAAKPRLDD